MASWKQKRAQRDAEFAAQRDAEWKRWDPIGHYAAHHGTAYVYVNLAPPSPTPETET